MTIWTNEAVSEWQAAGRIIPAAGTEVFVRDSGSPTGAETHDPLVLVHGFPTSSFDFQPVFEPLARERRVVAIDLAGFGLSAKADRHYDMALQADVVVDVLSALGIDRFVLVTHDMGDTVGGELLARTMDGTWPATVTRRVVTNGSIYIDMAKLTDGQLMLLSLPDEVAPAGPGPRLLAASLAATLSPTHRHIDMTDHAELVCHNDGDALLPRTIRYIEERRTNERRFTGAIETHPSPLHIVWGPEDPIAVAAMADRLKAARPDATLTWIDGAGHYPQIEDPAAWLTAVRAALS